MTDLEPFLTRKQINDARAKMLAYRDEMGYAPDDWDGIFECMAVFGEEIMNLLDAIEQITRDEQPQINQNEFVSWLIARLDTAEAEVAALKARVAELEAADQWRPVSEPPGAAGWYLGWNGYRIQIVQYLPEYEGDAIDWPWWDRYDDEIEITRWATLLDPPLEAPAP